MLYVPAGGPTGRNYSFLPTTMPGGTGWFADYSEHMIECSDGIKICVWHIKQLAHRTKPTIIFFHANAGARAHALTTPFHLRLFPIESRGWGCHHYSARAVAQARWPTGCRTPRASWKRPAPTC